eukprot:GHRR01014618.1.p1 GENE.GHRR01014618.1~~GHRR01014618.1.p1  ORF type:complete len:292 (+),score=32.50 GHRR01014618.1:87-878(+)
MLNSVGLKLCIAGASNLALLKLPAMTAMLQSRANLVSMPVGKFSNVCSTSGRLPVLHHRLPVSSSACRQRARLALLASSRDTDKVVPSFSPAHAANEACSMDSWTSRLHWQLLLLMCSTPVPQALAVDGLKYNPTQGEGIVKTMSGLAYLALLSYFLFRVLNRRARKAREEKIAGQGPVTTVFTKLIEKATEGKPKPKVTALNAILGALQAGIIAAGLFTFTTKVEVIIAAQDLPSGYTVRNRLTPYVLHKSQCLHSSAGVAC